MSRYGNHLPNLTFQSGVGRKVAFFLSESVHKETCVDLRYDFWLGSGWCFEALWRSKPMDFYQLMYCGPISTVSRSSEALKAKCRESAALDPCVQAPPTTKLNTFPDFVLD